MNYWLRYAIVLLFYSFVHVNTCYTMVWPPGSKIKVQALKSTVENTNPTAIPKMQRNFVRNNNKGRHQYRHCCTLSLNYILIFIVCLLLKMNPYFLATKLLFPEKDMCKRFVDKETVSTYPSINSCSVRYRSLIPILFANDQQCYTCSLQTRSAV